MEENNNIKKAKETLYLFLDKMYQWNIYASEYSKKNGYSEENDILLENMIKPTIQELCSIKLQKEFFGNWSEISDYNLSFLELEKVEIITKNKIYFFFNEENRSYNKYRYTLVFKDKKWLIDKKDYLINDKWHKHYL